MALPMVPIFTQTVGAGGAASVTFNNIPQSFTDLKIEVSCRTTPTGYIDDGVSVSFNGDSSTNYSLTIIGSDGASPSSGRVSNGTSVGMFLAPTSYGGNTAFGSSSAYIPNYTSNTYKSIVADAINERNNQYILMRMNAGLWRSTSAITSLTISSSTFAQYSTFSLYGILRAGA